MPQCRFFGPRNKIWQKSGKFFPKRKWQLRLSKNAIFPFMHCSSKNHVPGPFPHHSVLEGVVGHHRQAEEIYTFLHMAKVGCTQQLSVPGLLVTGPPGTGKMTLLKKATEVLGGHFLELDPLDYMPSFSGSVPKRVEDAVAEFCNQLTSLNSTQWLGVIAFRGIDRLAQAGEAGRLLQTSLASLSRRNVMSVAWRGKLVPISPLCQVSFAATSSLPDIKSGRPMGFQLSNEPGTPQPVELPSNEIPPPTRADLLRYGYNNNLLDAFKIPIHLQNLSAEELTAMAQLPGSPMKAVQLARITFKMLLHFEPAALLAMGAKAASLGRNAHSLEEISLEMLRLAAFYRKNVAPAAEPVVHVITAATVLHGTQPITKPLSAVPEVQPIEENPPEADEESESSGSDGLHVPSSELAPGIYVHRPPRGSSQQMEAHLARIEDLARWTRKY